jgi:hypothetical protein
LEILSFFLPLLLFLLHPAPSFLRWEEEKERREAEDRRSAGDGKSEKEKRNEGS